MKNKMTLAWIDLETTGLDPKSDHILEVGLIITDEDLEIIKNKDSEPIANGNWIHRPDLTRTQIDQILYDNHIFDMHLANGLLEEVYRKTFYPSQILNIEHELMTKLRECGEMKTILLAGSSVHFDRMFLREKMPNVDAYLSHHHFDVSVLKRTVEMWVPEMTMLENQTTKHRVLSDLAYSMNIARWYRNQFLLPSRQV